jgi:hypothetical protein
MASKGGDGGLYGMASAMEVSTDLYEMAASTKIAGDVTSPFRQCVV